MEVETPAQFQQHLYDTLVQILPMEAMDLVKQALKQHADQRPQVMGDHCGPVDAIPRTLAACQDKLRRALASLSWFRKKDYLQGLLLSDTKRHEKANQQLREELNDLKKSLARSQQQLHSLLGVKPAPSDEADTDNPSSTKKKKRGKKRGAPKGHTGCTRPIPQTVDHITIIPPPEQCPHCQGKTITPCDDFIDKYIEDIPAVLRVVTQHRYQKGECQHCYTMLVDERATQGPPVSLGDNLKITLTLLRHEMGVTYRKLSQFSRDICGIPLTPSGTLGIVAQIGQTLAPVHHAIEAALPKQTLLHADETGWKMDGQRWQLWVFCNPTLVYFHADSSRGAKVPEGIIGKDFDGLLITDFYASYNRFPHTQKCLVHFLRDIEKECAVSPEDNILKQLKRETKALIKTGKAIQNQDNSKVGNKNRIEKTKAINKRLKRMTALTSDNERTQTLIKRVINYKASFIRFIDYPDADYHNNHAEQTIRFAVIFRKLSFGNRTEEGAKLFGLLASVFATCRRNHVDVMALTKSLLHAPPTAIAEIIRAYLPLLSLSD